MLEQLLLVGGEQVDARRDDPLHGLGQTSVDAATRLEHAHELLRVERVAGRALDELALRLGVE